MRGRIMQLARDRNLDRASGGSGFAGWLCLETRQCGWSTRELAHRSRLSAAIIDGLLASATRPTWEQCVRISHAFRMSPTAVFRKAGLLPTTPRTGDELLQEAMEALSLLPEGPILNEATEAIRAIAQQAYHRSQGARTGNEQAP